MEKVVLSLINIYKPEKNSKVCFVVQEKKIYFHESDSLRASVCNIFNLYINDLDKMNKLNKTIT